MKKTKKIRFSFLLVLIGISPLLLSWGIFGHEHINRSAVFALPPQLRVFFYNHIDFVTQESTVPDLRKYTMGDKSENPRHFIDLENFGSVDSLPKTMADLKLKYDDKFLQKNGILPWYIEDMMEKLTNAFKEKRKTEILFIAADLGHYLGDAHMPLHTSSNYDGQLTNQKGIHALWEAQIPEMFGDNYNFYTGDAKYIEDVPKETWNIIFTTHRLADTLLAKDLQLRTKFPGDKMYRKDDAGNMVKNTFGVPVFSDDYAKQLNDLLNGMVEKQMKASISSVADFWYTAWVNAGKPDLSDLDSPELTKQNEKQLDMELDLWKKGKLFGLKSAREYQ
ncbi:MAG TPA: zinc dependent phospholipase C family protein [Bacteroidia bacterium]|nr:zinc dependent phospholipase C family protein [Bacteroidia bacterium]